MRKFTFVFSLLLMLVTTATAQKVLLPISHEGWKVTALNEAGVYGNEGGVAFIADDNAKTFYHSDYNAKYDGRDAKKGQDGLQAFMVEFPEVVSDILAITYTGRSDKSSGWARGVRIYVFETLPDGWPADLSSLSYDAKEDLLSKDNLGTAAFDNTAKMWDNDRTKKTADFIEAKKGKYVLFIMETGSDNWLTCADFQIYSLREFTGIKEKYAYKLLATNAKAEGDWFVDTKTAIADNQGLSTVAISQTAVETYFAWGEKGWKISTNENVDGNYVGVAKWCAPPLQETATEWQMLVEDNNELVLFQNEYFGADNVSRRYLGGNVTTDAAVSKLYTDNNYSKALRLKLLDPEAKRVTVTYNIKYKGETKATTEAVKTFTGEEYPEVNVELPFGVSANKPEGKIAHDVADAITVDIDAVVSLPFEFADSEANIEKWYYVQMHSSSGHQKYLQYHADNYIEWADATMTAEQEDSYSWAFVGNPFDGLKLVNRFAPAEANAVTSANDSSNPGFGPIAGATAWNIKASRTNVDSEHFCFQYPNSNQYMNAQSGKVAFWWDNDNGSTMWVTERKFPVTVTYNIKYKGEIKATTEAVETFTGEVYPEVNVELPFGVSANKPEGEILLSHATLKEGVYTIIKDVDAVVSLPFEFADSDANIEKWYYVQMHSSSGYQRYLQYHAGNYIEWADATRTAGEEDSYSWAFVGNPFDGLKLVNRFAPAEANAVTSAKDSGNPGFGPIGGATAWNIKASRTNVESKYFCFQYPGSTQYMNAQSGKVAFWGDNDQGSTMWVTERDFTMTTELQALIDQVDAAIVAYGEGGNTVGYYTEESVNNLLTVLAAAKTAVADPDRTLDTNRAAMTNLEAAVAALKTIQPEENVLYTIQNVYSGVYMNVTKTGGTVKSGDATAYELFKFVAAEGGKYYLYNVTRNKYLSSAPKHGYGQVLFAAETTAEAKAVTIANLGKANQVSIVPDGGATVHHDANYGTIVAWNGGIDSRSAWVIAATGLLTAKMTVLTELGILCSEKDDLLDKAGEGYGYYSGNDEALLAALSPELYSKTVTELAEMTDDAVAAAGTAAVNAVTEAANTFSLNVPAANSYVRIAYDFGGETGKLYVQGEASGVPYKANAPKMTAATDAASIFYFGDSLLSYTAGLYLKEDGGTRGLQAMNAKAGLASFEAGSVVGNLAVKVPSYMHANTEGDVRFIDHCGNSAGHTAHNMIVEAVTALPVTVTGAGYASFYAPVALEIPEEGVEVFYATQVNGDYVSLVKIEDVIPAETGVIIKAAEGTYNFVITDEEVADIEGNIFNGTVEKQVVTKGTSSCYVLGIVDGNVGMYNAVNGGDTATFINAGHKAYMCVEGAANSAGYRFDFDGTTGITEVETENADDAVIYDLTGRRVQDMNRAGIYIVNGKKVLVK